MEFTLFGKVSINENIKYPQFVFNIFIWGGACWGRDLFTDRKWVNNHCHLPQEDFLRNQQVLMENPPFGESILGMLFLFWDSRLTQMCQETSFRKAYGTEAIIMGTFGYSKDRVIWPSLQGNLSHRNGDRTSLNDVGIL